MITPCLCVLAALALLAAPSWSDVPLHEFEDLSVWRPSEDDGHPPEFSTDTEHSHKGSAMRLRYVDEAPHWGNLTGPCEVPPDARALRFRVYKHSAQGNAALHIWLFEPDEDAWLQRVPFGDLSLASASVGWHEIRMTIAAFRFQPRGEKTREMLAAKRMLIGCNFGDLDVTLDSMTWEIGPAQTRIPLPTTDDLQIERGDLGSVGVLDLGEGLPADFATAHPPRELAEAIRAGGFGATPLRPGDLADPALLTPENFDAIALPFGPCFPLEARDSFLAYLRAGGSFLSTDGYAFERLLLLAEDGWSTIGPELTAKQMDDPPETPPPMNTSAGSPGDQLGLKPEQIGVFDPHFRLQHATSFRLAPDFAQSLADRPPTYNLDAPVSGFSACGLIGVSSAVFPPVYRRWIPVLEAFALGPDSPTRREALRGTALSIMHNYAGEYAGSSWAFSGLTDGADIFLADQSRRALLVRVLRDITEKVFLHNLTTEFASYQIGEDARISVRVSNRGPRKMTRTVNLSLGLGATATVLHQEVDLEPGETLTLEKTVPLLEAHRSYDFVPVHASLSDGARTADRMESAFCIHNERVLAKGPDIGWRDNYMTVDGEPSFLIGTNQTGMMYFSDHENPAIWDRDFGAMADHGCHILRILHFSPFAKGGYEGKPPNNPLDLAERPKRLVRQMDAIVQLAQKHRVAIFLSLHDWMGTVLTDEELKSQADWNRFWVDRYKQVPGIFYDVQNEPKVRVLDRPDVVALWNEFLRERYGTDEALRAAWIENPPEGELPDVPLGAATQDWEDVRSADRKRFEAELLNRWAKANVQGVRDGDADALVCIGYLPSMPPADKILGVKHTDFSNMHYYGPPQQFPLEFKLIDRRFLGKGFSLGEFGAREAHDGRARGYWDVPTQAGIDRFQTYIHYAAGMGAAFIANWDWKDFDEMVFPWGLMTHCSYITKPWLHTLEQEWLLLAGFRPAYESPEVFVLAPDSNRIGPRFNELHNALRRSVDLMLDQRVNFGVVNEEDIGSLPASAKALVWPLPYCPTDETFAQVLEWVRAGGALYLSGDISFDRTRKPTRADRRGLLGLPEAPAHSPFETPEERWNQDAAQTQVGAGKVLFAPYPLELRERPTDAAVYARFIALAGLSPIGLAPPDSPVRVLSIPDQAGGRLYMAARTTDGDDLLSVSPAETGVTVELAGRGFSFVRVGPDGALLAAESQGAITAGGQELARADDHFAICSLDGRDLRETTRLLVLPHQCAQVQLRLPGFAEARVWIGTPAGAGAIIPETADGRLKFPPGTPGQVALVAALADIPSAVRELEALIKLRDATR